METHLPDFVIAKLYKDNLVVVPTSDEPALPCKTPAKDREINTMVEKPQWTWLGGNKQNISIVVDDADNIFISEKKLQFLSDILSACKFDVNDVAIINIAKTPASFDQITEAAKSRYLLLFGADAKKILLPQPLNLFENKVMKNVSCLNSPSLETLMQPASETKTLKGKLWRALQIMFQIA